MIAPMAPCLHAWFPPRRWRVYDLSTSGGTTATKQSAKGPHTCLHGRSKQPTGRLAASISSIRAYLPAAAAAARAPVVRKQHFHPISSGSSLHSEPFQGAPKPRHVRPSAAGSTGASKHGRRAHFQPQVEQRCEQSTDRPAGAGWATFQERRTVGSVCGVTLCIMMARAGGAGGRQGGAGDANPQPSAPPHETGHGK